MTRSPSTILVGSDPAVRATVCNTGSGAPCNDHGIIQNGNVQIHQDDPTVIDQVVFNSA